jgi:hypothetical protein
MKFAILPAALALAAIALPAGAYTEIPPPSDAKLDLSGLHDFDFIAGEWRAHHRKLKERLAGSHDWIEFDGTQSARLLMGGYANMDDNIFDVPGGAYRGVTLRAYDPKTGLWAIWWLDGRYPDGAMDPPMKGRFEDGVGTFYANDTFKGKPIRVRFIWKSQSPTRSHWEQAFSPDGGHTWETNWTTDFERIK